jgi:ABC-2 type transport system permease protein
VTRFVTQCLAVAARDLALRRTYRASLLLGLGSGVLGLCSYHFIGRLVDPGAGALGGQGYFGFVCVGLMVQGVVAAALGGLGSGLAREANEGTLEPALLAGASPSSLVVGSALTPVGLALVQALLYAAAGGWLLGLDLGSARLGPALLALGLTLLACAPIGLLGAASWLVLRRPGAVTTLAIFAFGFLGGVYFPASLLPEPLALLARAVPVESGLGAVRAAFLEGAGWRDVVPALLRLVALAAVALPPAALVFQLALRRAQRRGSLVHV